jgi:anti-anti-sigma factor
MEITTVDLGGVTKISLTGSLDLKSTPDLESRFASMTENVQSAIIDLSGIDYLSSIGVRYLIGAARTVASRGGRLVLLNPQTVVRTVLFTTGVDKVMPILFDDEEAERAARLPIARQE